MHLYLSMCFHLFQLSSNIHSRLNIVIVIVIVKNIYKNKKSMVNLLNMLNNITLDII